MTWLVADLLDVRNIYLAAFYETLGTMVMMIIVLVPLNTAVYRRRKRELNTLSNAIQRVAGGDYTARIPLEKAGQMLPIYEDFNKMCAELESVRILRNALQSWQAIPFSFPSYPLSRSSQIWRSMISANRSASVPSFFQRAGWIKKLILMENFLR